MVKPEWGLKRTCSSCGAKFYDLRRDPIICPKCDATVDPAATSKSQRAKAAAPAAKEAPVVPKEKVAVADDDLETAEPDVLEGDDVLEIVDDDDDDDAAAIEDVSELGEDDDDMLGVIDKTADEGEETR